MARWVAAEELAARANPARVATIRHCAGVGGILLTLTGLAVAIGWAVGNTALTSVAPGLASMKWWCAACFVLLGLGIALPTMRDTPAFRRIGLALGGLVALLALSFLLEYLTGATFGHDNVFGFDTAAASAHPGRMAQTTAVCLILLGTSLALHKIGRIRTAQAIAVPPTAIAFLALLGYVFGVSPLYSGVRFASMAVHTAAGLLVAGLAILALRSDEGYVAIISSNTAGGRLARRLLGPALFVPPALGWIANLLVGRRMIDAAFALALMATTVSILGAIAIWRESATLSTIDLQRAGTVAALRRVRAAEARQTALAVALEEHVRRTEAILDSAADAFIGIDGAGVITSWNPAAQRLYGWGEAEAVGARFDELLPVLHADGHEITGRVDATTLDAAIARGPLDYAVMRQDGTIAEVESRVWAQERSDGRTYTAMVRDVGQRRQAERELLELNRSLDEFAAVAAHDLRGPIAAIRVNLELVEDAALERDDEDELATIARIQRAADRGLALIDDLLTYSRAGRGTIEPRRVDLTDLARRAADDVTARVGRPCAFEVEELPAIAGDAGTLRQVLVNLLYNAVHYCPADRLPQVRVTAEPAADRRQVLVHVIDNGDGIPVSERERVFEMFQRGTSCGELTGTGVGLALCRRRAARRHDPDRRRPRRRHMLLPRAAASLRPRGVAAHRRPAGADGRQAPGLTPPT